MADPERPDGMEERLVRIETRLVKYQEANTLVLEAIKVQLGELLKALNALRFRR